MSHLLCVIVYLFVCFSLIFLYFIIVLYLFTSDFFDAGVKPDGEKAENVNTKPASMAEVLPEGFFDDPKMDAKVHTHFLLFLRTKNSFV
jgi:hypothetical protein